MSDISQRLLWPSTLLCFDITLETAVENLALDEALLVAVDANPSMACLRLWQPASYVVVLGRSNKVEAEVNVGACLSKRIPIIRRASGGGAVIVGPGCLCYSLVLPLTDQLRSLGVASVTRELMTRTAFGLGTHFPGIEVCGTSDLALNGHKFSGNAQRWLQNSFIHHGTILFDFNLSLIESCLRHPSREPQYRSSRSHQEFLMNLAIQPKELHQRLCEAWNTRPAECETRMIQFANAIAVSRYSSTDWTLSPVP